MLHKLLKVHKLSPFGRKAVTSATPQVPEDSSSVLKIVHAGGNVEFYYMAMPAVRILEKYPSYVLAKPDVFRRPWDSVVRPEKILTPGRTFFLVPLRTVNKLRRRNKKPTKDLSFSMASHESCQEDDVSVASSAFRKTSGSKKHVTFTGIDVKHKASGSSNTEKRVKSKRDTGKKPNSESGGGKRRTPDAIAWQPSLRAITESQGLRD